jgi:hypothetical protein
MGENSYHEALEAQYKEYIERTGKSYFAGQIDEAFETDAKGEPLKIG